LFSSPIRQPRILASTVLAAVFNENYRNWQNFPLEGENFSVSAIFPVSFNKSVNFLRFFTIPPGGLLKISLDKAKKYDTPLSFRKMRPHWKALIGRNCRYLR
jgi:hypothetical protein